MAVINIGSGSVKLYLQKTKETKAAVTLLALGGKKEEAAAATIDAVAAFCVEAKSKGEKIHIFGTEAMRRNKELAGFIQYKTGCPVDIIDEETEALCGFLGCEENRYKTVIDIGGASTEISSGRERPDFCVSLKTGSVALYNIFGAEENGGGSGQEPDIFQNNFIRRVFDYIDNILDFSPSVCKGKICLIGGTALYLAAVIKNSAGFLKPQDFNPKALSCAELKTEDVLTVLKTLFGMDLRQRTAAYPFLEEKRAIVLPYGTCVLYRILKKISADSAYISASGLIEGYIKLKNL